MLLKQFGTGSVRPIMLILLAAFAIKVILLFGVIPAASDFLRPRYGIGFGPLGDTYDGIARNLIQGIGYRVEDGASETMSREPGYVLYLAALFKTAGYRLEAIQVSNSVLMFGAALMVIFLAKRVTNDPNHGLIAALLLLFHPAIIIAETRGGVEIVFLFIVLLFMVVLHRALESVSPRACFAAGLTLGVVVMVRSTPAFFPLALCAYLMLTSPSGRIAHIKTTLLLVAGMAIVMLPWTIRNYSLVGQFVPMGTIAGAAAQEGLYICRCLTFATDFRDVVAGSGKERNGMARQLGLAFKDGPYHQVFYSARDEVVFSKSLLKGAAREYWRNPGLFAKCVAKRFLQMWFLGKTWAVTWLNVLLQGPMLILALCGGLMLWRRGELQNMGVMLVFTGYMVVLHMLVNSHARYSLPLLPFIAILISVTLITFWRKMLTDGQLQEPEVARKSGGVG